MVSFDQSISFAEYSLFYRASSISFAEYSLFCRAEESRPTSSMKESCHTWMSHATHEWVMSHMNESCHTWMSHVTCKEVVTSHMNESRHTCYCVMLRTYTSTVIMTHSYLTWLIHIWRILCYARTPSTVITLNTSNMNESRQIWMSHVKYEWVTSNMNESRQIRMSHVKYESASCYARTPSTVITLGASSTLNQSCHVEMSHVTHEWVISRMNRSRHGVMSHTYTTYSNRLILISGLTN